MARSRFSGGCFLVLFLVVFVNVAESFEWKSETFVRVTGCVGSKVTLPWQFVTTEGRETIETVYWYKGHEDQTMLASIYRDRFSIKPGNSDYKVLPRDPDMNAALVLNNTQLDHTGYYVVTVTVQTKDENLNDMKTEHRASALLTVIGDAPTLSGDKLTVHEVTSGVQTCALERQITLSCGNFTSRGFPPVDVVWTDPAGQVFPSTRFADGYFDLDLPRRPLPGSYRCHLSCQSPSLQCLSPSSPLLGKQFVHVTKPSSEGCSEATTPDPSEGQGEVTDDVESGVKRKQEFEDLLQNFTKLQESVKRLQDENDGLKNEAQSRSHENYNNLLGVVQNVSSKLDAMDHKFAELTKTTQCNATSVDLSPFVKRFDTLENSLALRAQDDQAEEELETDPLVSRLRQTFSLVSPADEHSKSLVNDVVVTPQGAVVMTDLYHSHVIIAENRPGSDVTTRRLKYGTHARQLTNMDGGLVAATVDDTYIYILNTTTTKSWAQRDRWILTKEKYHGLAARSEQTLFASVTTRDAGEGNARIDVISIHGYSAVVVTSLLNRSTAKKLNNPERLTVNDNHLYMVDTDVIMRLDLDTHKLSIITGPRSSPGLTFLEPRGVAFDMGENMYVATGGELCSSKLSHLYTDGFCVVVISREGSWRKVTSRGKDIRPYGVTLTPTGVAVTWVSWVRAPLRSMVQFYDLVPPRG
ncbi:uncharacterized protein [Littorina saxatilis]|uniref:Immunoglobulin V-set domain-containing protein n=1 Tax=Littorina saxatilis TaxID=31220 RepID=A0AAN9AT03_9CAEN